MFRGPYVYKGVRSANCEVGNHSLKVGQSYYLLTGYGPNNMSTFCESHVSPELKIKATQQRVDVCQNCFKRIATGLIKKLDKCPECGFPYDEQFVQSIENNMAKDSILTIRNGMLREVKRR